MKLLSPKTGDSRPIIDRVKESLFSVLFKYDLPQGTTVADLFCGVGSLGLEALSRGAEFVTFVEKDPKVVSTLNKNIEKAGFVRQSKVIRANAFKIGAPLDLDRNKYDLVFVDPPYACTQEVGAGSQLDHLLSLVCEQIDPQGLAVVRTRKDTELLNRYGRLTVSEHRQWGTMTITFLQLSDDDKQAGGDKDS
jgi:16S rRNA (guanine(966)-N(2))-methyltransferase RsmD